MLTFSKKTRPTKIMGKTLVLTRFLHLRVCARASKINRKSHRMRFSSDSRHREPSNELFPFAKRRNCLRGVSGAPRKASWGSSGTLLAANWTLLARPWALLGSFGAALGRSWCVLGDASSRKFSKLRLPEQIFFDLGSVWARKPAKSCQNNAKS